MAFISLLSVLWKFSKVGSMPFEVSVPTTWITEMRAGRIHVNFPKFIKLLQHHGERNRYICPIIIAETQKWLQEQPHSPISLLQSSNWGDSQQGSTWIILVILSLHWGAKYLPLFHKFVYNDSASQLYIQYYSNAGRQVVSKWVINYSSKCKITSLHTTQYSHLLTMFYIHLWISIIQ